MGGGVKHASPHLPHHDQGTTNRRRCAFGSIHGHRRTLASNAQAQHEAGNEQVDPGVGDTLPDTGHGGNKAGHEDGASPAQDAVQGRREPASQEATGQVGCADHQAGQIVHHGLTEAATLGVGLDVESGQVEGLGAIVGGLVHALDGGTQRAHDDEVVEGLGLVPLVRHLSLQVPAVVVGELGDGFEGIGVLGDERPFAEDVVVGLQVVSGAEVVDVLHEPFLRHIAQRVLEHGIELTARHRVRVRIVSCLELLLAMLWALRVARGGVFLVGRHGGWLVSFF